MPHDRSADAAPDQPGPDAPVPDAPDIVEWGDDALPRRRPHRLGAVGRLDRLRGDRRLAPLAVAVLGMGAVFGSLVVQWGHISILRLDPDGTPAVEIGTAATDLGGLGAGYVVGVLAIAGLAALAIFGAPPARSSARIVGAATTAGVLVVLIAATFSLDAAVRRMYAPIWPQIDVEVTYGRGLALAYVATATMGLALYLAGRSDGWTPAAEPDRTGAGPGTEGDDRAPTASVGRPRSRPDRSRPEDDVRDMTVRPTAPFTRPEWEDRYR